MVTEATDHETGEGRIVYRHIYPFHDTGCYVRNVCDFQQSFRLIDEATVARHMTKDKDQFQRRIASNKTDKHSIFDTIK